MGKFKLLIILVIMVIFSVDIVSALSLENVNDSILILDLDNAEYTRLWTGEFNSTGTGDCNSIANVATMINDNILKPLRYLIPILFLILTSVEFAKSVFTDDKSGIGKTKNNLLKRAIISIIFYFVPMIVETLMNLFNISC